MFLVQSSDNLTVCPFCNAELRYRDSRIRIRKREGGYRDKLMIRRLKCTTCHALHNELPDCLVPYKHYESEVISGVLDSIVTPNDADSEDFPSMQTMLRWLQWFQMNLANIEGHLRNAGYSIFDFSSMDDYINYSLLDTIRSSYQNWLEIILRIIYNSGGFLPGIPW